MPHSRAGKIWDFPRPFWHGQATAQKTWDFPRPFWHGQARAQKSWDFPRPFRHGRATTQKQTGKFTWPLDATKPPIQRLGKFWGGQATAAKTWEVLGRPSHRCKSPGPCTWPLGASKGPLRQSSRSLLGHGAPWRHAQQKQHGRVYQCADSCSMRTKHQCKLSPPRTLGMSSWPKRFH